MHSRPCLRQAGHASASYADALATRERQLRVALRPFESLRVQSLRDLVPESLKERVPGTSGTEFTRRMLLLLQEYTPLQYAAIGQCYTEVVPARGQVGQGYFCSLLARQHH